MTWQTPHINGAQTSRQGTTTRTRYRLANSAGWLVRRPGIAMFGIVTSPQGGRTP